MKLESNDQASGDYGVHKVANLHDRGDHSNLAAFSNENNPNTSRDMKNMEKKIEIRKM